MTPTEILRSIVGPVVNRPAVYTRVLEHPRVRPRSLVILWHRTGPDGPAPHEVVPTVSTDMLREHIEILSDLGDIVALGDIAEGEPRRRPRYALTFDDDYTSHARWALPVLRELGVPATFFLSGRWLHGLGPYWWELLEERIEAEGLDRVAASYGHRVSNAPELGRQLQGTVYADALAEEGARRTTEERMTSEDARTLAEAGMEIGFHTVEHDVLPRLDDAALDAALTRGREELARDVGRPLRRFAYPHGVTSERVAARTAAAGYPEAWTASHRPVVPGDDRYWWGRWEAGVRAADAFVVGILRRLLVPPPRQ